MSGEERVPCPCPCGCRASSAGGPCWLCARELHRPPAAIAEHLEEGAELAARLLAAATPASSSGLSARGLRRVMERWRDWHDRRPCPVERPARRRRAA